MMDCDLLNTLRFWIAQIDAKDKEIARLRTELEQVTRDYDYYQKTLELIMGLSSDSIAVERAKKALELK